MQLSILSLDVTKPQSILIGIYFAVFFIGVPRLFLLIINELKVQKSITFFLFISGVIAKNFCILLLVKYPSLPLIVCVSSIEFLHHYDLRSKMLNLIPKNYKTYIAALLLSISFSFFIYPRIPVFLGGAKPIQILVYPKNQELLKNRFSKSNPNSVFLLYESEKDLYIIRELKTNGIVIQKNVIRIKKQDIEKIIYTNPVWLNF